MTEKTKFVVRMTLTSFRYETLSSSIKGRHRSHDDYGKTIGDIEKRFFAFNCQQKKLYGKFYLFDWISGSPDIFFGRYTHLLLEQYFWWIPGRKKRVSIFFSNFILKIPI
jgi:hypothetical protein